MRIQHQFEYQACKWRGWIFNAREMLARRSDDLNQKLDSNP